MTVAAASLDNLIPQSRKWAEFVTTPIRVPATLKNWVLDMVNQKVAELRVSLGAEPTNSSEDVWIRQMIGLPDDYELGSDLPDIVKEEIAEIRSDAAVAFSQSGDTLDSHQPLAVDETEPAPFTQAWVDWSEAQFPGWKWTEYLRALKQDVAAGSQDAKAEIAQFKANGVNVDDGSPRVNPDRRAAKMARRAERAKKSGVKQAPPVPELPDYDRVMHYYFGEIELFDEQLAEFYAELEERGLKGKIRRFQHCYREWEAETMKNLYPTREQYADTRWMAKNSQQRKTAQSELAAEFYATETQQSDDSLDGQFYNIMMILVRSLSAAMACVEADIVIAQLNAASKQG